MALINNIMPTMEILVKFWILYKTQGIYPRPQIPLQAQGPN